MIKVTSCVLAICLSKAALCDVLMTTYVRSLGDQVSVLATIDPVSGGVEEVAMTSGAYRINSLGFDSGSGVLYAIGLLGDFGPSWLFELDMQTGSATAVGPTGVDHIGGLAYDPESDTLFAAAWNGGIPQGSALYEIDRRAGAATLIGEAPLTPDGMTWDIERSRLL